MIITILGSGTSTGVPMVGCECPVCTSDDPHDKRTRCSILIEHCGRNILIDTSTDLRAQALREKINRIDAVLYTHHHADHINGIDDLRGFNFIHRTVVPCYGDHETMTTITENFSYIFSCDEPSGYRQLLQAHTVNSSFDLFGLTIIPIPLRHGKGDATGYRFGNAAYLTDVSEIPAESFPLLEELDLLIIDALRYTPHTNHLNIDSAIEMVRRIAPRRTLLTHLTHEVPHCDETKLPERIRFAYDGLKLEL